MSHPSLTTDCLLSPVLRPTAEHCPHCGVFVQVRHWVMATEETPGRWEEETVPLSPVCGIPHRCEAGARDKA